MPGAHQLPALDSLLGSQHPLWAGVGSQVWDSPRPFLWGWLFPLPLDSSARPRAPALPSWKPLLQTSRSFPLLQDVLLLITRKALSPASRSSDCGELLLAWLHAGSLGDFGEPS